jgi:hypothetical protein
VETGKGGRGHKGKGAVTTGKTREREDTSKRKSEQDSGGEARLTGRPAGRQRDREGGTEAG